MPLPPEELIKPIGWYAINADSNAIHFRSGWHIARTNGRGLWEVGSWSGYNARFIEIGPRFITADDAPASQTSSTEGPALHPMEEWAYRTNAGSQPYMTDDEWIAQQRIYIDQVTNERGVRHNPYQQGMAARFLRILDERTRR